jgi:restriction system protein
MGTIDFYEFRLLDRPLALRSNLQLLSEYIGNNAQRSRTILIKGSEESGKTELARTYIARNLPSRTEVEWVDLEKEPDPLQAIELVIIRLREARTRNRLLVVLDGAEGLHTRQLNLILSRLFNLKVVSTVIVTTRNTEIKVRGAKEIYTRRYELPIDPWRQPRRKLYGLKDQTSQKKIIELVAPQIITANDSLIFTLKKRPGDLYRITPRQFEEVIADLLTDMGMDVELTPATRDGGKDILAFMKTDIGKFLCLVEAKQYNKHRPVGVSLVRSLFGTVVDHQATSGMLVTTSRFAKPAKEFQERHKYQLSLKDYSDVVSWLLKYKA